MKRIYALSLLLLGISVSARVAAANHYSCCSLATEDGACVAQSAPCAESIAYGAALSDSLDADAGLANVSFPSGIDGYVAWTESAPWVGFCLDAPAPQDPTHAGPTEPIACMTLSLAPGVAVDEADFQVPESPRWDAYQICFGARVGPADSGVACQNVNDLDDPTISPTPVSGSCCGPPQLLRLQGSSGAGWDVAVTQEIPGAPPPVLVLAPDGGVVVDDQPDAGDRLGSVPDACVAAYNEPKGCGTAPADADLPPGLDAGSDDAGPAQPAQFMAPTGWTCAVNGTRASPGERGAAWLVCMIGISLARRGLGSRVKARAGPRRAPGPRGRSLEHGRTDARSSG
jgi:hypothetical protein